MRYKGIEITKTETGKYKIISPYNGTVRIFKNKELLKNYIDNWKVIDINAKYICD